MAGEKDDRYAATGSFHGWIDLPPCLLLEHYFDRKKLTRILRNFWNQIQLPRDSFKEIPEELKFFFLLLLWRFFLNFFQEISIIFWEFLVLWDENEGKRKLKRRSANWLASSLTLIGKADKKKKKKNFSIMINSLRVSLSCFLRTSGLIEAWNSSWRTCMEGL